MKKILTLLLFLGVTVCAFAEDFSTPKKLTSSGCWGRDATPVLTDEGDGVQAIAFDGKLDFSSSYLANVEVKPGEIYELKCEMRTEGNGRVGISAALGVGKEVTQWGFASQSVKNPAGTAEFEQLTCKFIIPGGFSLMVPRVTGGGSGEPFKVFFRNYTIQKVGQVEIPAEDETFELANDFLKLTFHSRDASFNVQDLRTGRVWKQAPQNGFNFPVEVKKKNRSVEFRLVNALTVSEITAKVQISKSNPEIRIKVSGDHEMTMNAPIAWPPAFESEANDRLILPVNEGISFPAAEEDAQIPGRLYTYGGHGLCMAFFAQCEEEFVPAKGSDPNAPNQAGEVRGKSGFLAIYETPDDAAYRLGKTEEGFHKIQPEWDAQKKKLGYDRVLRFVFFDQADITTMLKYYRAYADSLGLVVPFTEKLKRNPNLKEGFDRLIGAANIWAFCGNKTKIYEELQAGGVKKILASSNGSPEEIKAWNEMPNILTSRYDIYQDSMDPKNFPLVGKADAWTSEAWERDELMTDANGNWIRGWEVSQKDKTKPRIPCGVLCDTCAVPYELERVGKELPEKPYRARFIDTTTASPWRECYHPKHPCTRTESKNAKMELLGTLGKKFNLVTGSETGHEASVPFCDFYEGMMSLGPYRVPDSGRNIPQIWDEAPERTTKYQVGESYRMPLWELVYHDCTVSYWYWGDYNNKLPSLWVKRDLFNALYGVPPMYIFTGENYEKFKEQIFESAKTAMPVAEKTGWYEMTSFRILSKDRTVQETQFADGTKVTANFGDLDYTMPDGFVLKAKTMRME